MKILVFSQYWAPENGVPQRRWQWLTELLIGEGHELLVVAPPPHYLRKVQLGDWIKQRKSYRVGRIDRGVHGEQILRSGFLPAGNSVTEKIVNQASVAVGMSLELVKSRETLTRFNPDLIVGTVPAIPTALVAFLASRVMRTPYAIDLRDAWPDLLDQSSEWNRGLGKKSFKELLLSRGPLQILQFTVRKVLDMVLERADGLIVTSGYLERQLSRKFETSAKRPITTIRNVFPSHSTAQESSVEMRSRSELNVLYAGTLGRAQHLQNVVQAARIARDLGLVVSLRFVGAGSAKKTLIKDAEEGGVSIEFVSQHPSDELSNFYDWADTALVHLTDWEPLRRAVPSKTYELMEVGKHISGVVEGEAADLIRELGAGHVVKPEDPYALAQLWLSLARDRKLLQVDRKASQWVRHERESVVPSRLNSFLSALGGEGV
ncbi:glycosyltransferase family 4 protein [Corynebacterium hadale]|uniref:glycosyltransferase family 4 protein n=1 Tax=Corynebacterium hadale TaxID=2026255 RepID=UPI000BAA7CA3|nr:glycosyltransferase family 4 protein [Corynebacterium hadale]PAT08268.1 glycosyltransferase WbuB [Corynebacterium hadale]